MGKSAGRRIPVFVLLLIFVLVLIVLDAVLRLIVLALLVVVLLIGIHGKNLLLNWCGGSLARIGKNIRRSAK